MFKNIMSLKTDFVFETFKNNHYYCVIKNKQRQKTPKTPKQTTYYNWQLKCRVLSGFILWWVFPQPSICQQLVTVSPISTEKDITRWMFMWNDWLNLFWHNLQRSWWKCTQTEMNNKLYPLCWKHPLYKQHKYTVQQKPNGFNTPTA